MSDKQTGFVPSVTEKPGPEQRVDIARNPLRPNIREYIAALFTDFFEIHGDRQHGDDTALLCGIAKFEGMPVTVAGNIKGRELSQNIACNFGMSGPEGYRKFQRAITQAEKFGRPVITFVDTPGAYPGKEAEERGQGEAIARCLYLLSGLKTPVIAFITGEGGSGGALAMALADKVIMLENAVYSVLSPEGFASILWKDPSRRDEASLVMKLTADDLLSFGIIDFIISEPPLSDDNMPGKIFAELRELLRRELGLLKAMQADEMLRLRYQKYRLVGMPPAINNSYK